jgi:UDP-N-acetylmuramyl pentapeptide phosphotransferase/UDP-N-acetylglucosamine-1-phosphate transferase
MSRTTLGVLLAVTAALSYGVVRVVRVIALRRSLLDRPNERSAHVTPTPRLGGIGIMVAFFASAVYVAIARDGRWQTALLVLATGAISVVGLVDDLRPLPARVRFAAQLVAATAVVAASGPRLTEAWTLLPLPAWIAAPLSVLWIVWLTNLYNFMDGIDGIAGGQAVIAGASIGAAAFAVGAQAEGALALAAAAAAAGFLTLNFPPARIFMGDVGSTALGFFFASLPFLPSSRAAVPVEVVGLALALFVLDATWTVIRRMARGERFFQAHRTHWYQRPLAQGVSHRSITLAVFPGMVAMGAAAVAYVKVASVVRAVLVVSAVGLFAAYASLVLQLERRAAALAPEAGSDEPKRAIGS